MKKALICGISGQDGSYLAQLLLKNGYQVFGKLKENGNTADIPVIFVTALTDEQDETKGLEMGAVDYITKPIKIPVALARVRTHLALRFAYRKLAEQNEELIRAAAELNAM